MEAVEKKRAQPGIGRRIARSAALTLILLFAMGVTFTMFMEDGFIYFPGRDGVGDSPGEDVELTTADGVKIHGWYLPHPEAKAALLYLHGNGGHIGDRRSFIQDLRDLPANVLALDYRGYGRSEGRPSEDGLYSDARAAYDWLARSHDPRRIVVLGKSLGAAPACELATRAPLGGLVMQSSFTSIADMSRRVLPFFPARWFLRHKYDNLSKVPRVACPKLFIHGRRDEMIPFEMAERLHAAAAEPKRAAWFDRGDHNGLIDENGRAYFDELRRFLDDVVR